MCHVNQSGVKNVRGGGIKLELGYLLTGPGAEGIVQGLRPMNQVCGGVSAVFSQTCDTIMANKGANSE